MSVRCTVSPPWCDLCGESRTAACTPALWKPFAGARTCFRPWQAGPAARGRCRPRRRSRPSRSSPSTSCGWGSGHRAPSGPGRRRCPARCRPEARLGPPADRRAPAPSRRPDRRKPRWHGAYCASKSAVVAYCESLRGECRPFGVSVVTLLPGYIDTPLTRGNRYSMWSFNPS